MTSQPKGLPGFLRRSLRFTEEEKETEDFDANATVHANGNGNANTNANTNSNTNSLPPRPIILTPTGTPMATPAPTPILSKATRQGMPEIPSMPLEKSGHGSWREDPPEPPPSTTTKSKSSLERNTSYKDRQLDAALFADVVNMTELKSLCWNGIPPHCRAQAWKILLGYLPTNRARRAQTLARKRAEYKDAIHQHYDIDDDVRTVQEQETLRQVLVDVPRTAPEVGLFRNDRIRKALSRLLFVWAMRHPASSYVQGINDLATPLIAVFLGDYFPDCNADDVLDGTVMERVTEAVMEEVRLCRISVLIDGVFLVLPSDFIFSPCTMHMHIYHIAFTGRSRLLLVHHKTPSWHTRSLHIGSTGRAAYGDALGGTCDSH